MLNGKHLSKVFFFKISLILKLIWFLYFPYPKCDLFQNKKQYRFLTQGKVEKDFNIRHVKIALKSNNMDLTTSQKNIDKKQIEYKDKDNINDKEQIYTSYNNSEITPVYVTPTKKKKKKNFITIKKIDIYFENLIYSFLESISYIEEPPDYELYNNEINQKMKEYLFIFEPVVFVFISVYYLAAGEYIISIIISFICSVILIYILIKIRKYDKAHNNFFTFSNMLKEFIQLIKNIPKNILNVVLHIPKKFIRIINYFKT
ncbi:virulence-associated protein 1 [Plasmodium sp. gorilla clade G1]|nr:virulence-associated protein 1 [Plasmodium sp. gorilla clade G1]